MLIVFVIEILKTNWCSIKPHTALSCEYYTVALGDTWSSLYQNSSPSLLDNSILVYFWFSLVYQPLSEITVWHISWHASIAGCLCGVTISAITSVSSFSSFVSRGPSFPIDCFFPRWYLKLWNKLFSTLITPNNL